MLLKTTSLELLSIIVLRDDADKLTESLVATGNFQPIDLYQTEKDIPHLSISEYKGMETTLEYCETIFNTLLTKLSLDLNYASNYQDLTIPVVKDKINQITANFTPIIGQIDALRIKLQDKNFLLEKLHSLSSPNISLKENYQFLSVHLGKIHENMLNPLATQFLGITYILYPFKTEKHIVNCILIGLKKDASIIRENLEKLHWEKNEEIEINSQQLNQEIIDYKTKLNSLENERQELITQWQTQLSQIKTFLALKKSILKATSYLHLTEKTAIIVGWIPEEERKNILKILYTLTPYIYIETKSAQNTLIKKEQIPIWMNHNKFLKPFELLLEGYGLPRYGAIDPTLFIAISFLIMFGLMFGDVGHGFVLALSSFFFINNKKRSIAQIAVLIRYCGISSIIFGFLFGSFFGWEFPSIWIKPLHDILKIFQICIIYGIITLSLATVLNIINSVRDRNYVKAFFDKSGLFAGIIYWSVISLFFQSRIEQFTIPPAYFYIISASIIAIFLKPTIEYFIKKKPQNVCMGIIESCVEILEIFLGYLANTISFIRIAAFALAHTGLFLAVFELSKLLETKSSLLSIATIILGNIFIIILEGLVVSIQSLRLNYYEFLSRFFVTGNNKFSPLSIAKEKNRR